MKNLIFIYIASYFFIYNLSGQNTGDLQLPFAQTDYVQILGMSGNDMRNLSNNKLPDKVDGSPYLYESWNNSGKVFFLDKEYSLKSFNYNLYLDRFEAKLSKDSVFVINSSNVHEVLFNYKIFKHYIDPESQKIRYFEELIDFDNYRILRKNAVKIKPGATNPLTKEKLTNDQLIKEESYYIFDLNDNSLIKIKLKKATFQTLFRKEALNNVKNYVNENHLNYRDPEDVKKIVEHYNTL